MTERMAAPAGTVLAAADLGKRFGDREALRDVSLEATAGELVAVIGPNGAGKTTLLSILAGIIPPDCGSVSHSAADVGWVPQQAAVYGKLTVAENLRLFARLERVDEPEAAVERMLDLTGLRERAGDLVTELSGGNRQRVNIAVGLVGEQDVLLLDEPSAALDPRQRERVWEFVLGLARAGTTVVYSTHNVMEAERHADRVLVLADGELLFTGSPAELEQTVTAEPAASAREGIGAQPAEPAASAREGIGAQPAEPAASARDFEQAFVAFLRARGH